MSSKKINDSRTVAELQAELDQVLAWFNADEASIDDVESMYKKGLELTSIIKGRLDEIENRVEKIKQSFQSLE